MLTSLPDPSETLQKAIEVELWSFLWHGKKDRIKRTKIVQSVQDGGLGMVDLRSFINGLKISWIKRLWASNSAWANFARRTIKSLNNVFLHGNNQSKKDSERINNMFWKHVIRAWSQFNGIVNPSLSVEEIMAERIWFSDFTKFKYAIIRLWDSSGIKFIYDLWNNVTRKLYIKNELEQKYGIRINFLDYATLIRSLPQKYENITVK